MGEKKEDIKLLAKGLEPSGYLTGGNYYCFLIDGSAHYVNTPSQTQWNCLLPEKQLRKQFLPEADW